MIILSLIIGVIAIVTSISVTYAYWTSTHVSNSNIVRSGCLNIEYKELSDSVDLRRIGPGYNDGRYVFSITNTCNTVINYQVNMETLEGSTLDSSYIYLYMYGDNLFDLKPTIADEYDEYYENNQLESFFDNEMILSELEEVTPTLNNAIKAHKIYSYSIKSNETHVYDLYANIRYDLEDNEGEDKEWYSKVTVVSVPAKQVKVTLDPNGGYIDSNYLYLVEGDTYGNLPQPTKDQSLFLGWYLDGNEDGYVSNNTHLLKDNNHTLIAKYLNISGSSFLEPYAFYNYVDNYETNEYGELVASPFITSVRPYNALVNDEIINNAYLISESGVPTYAWVDGNTLYYWSTAEKIFMQQDKFENSTYGNNFFENLETIDISRIDTSKMTDMSNMFSNLKNLVYLNLNDLDTSNVRDMSQMFYYLKNIELDFSNFNTSNVTNMDAMFAYSSINNLDLSHFDTSKVTNMSAMFSNSSFSSLDLSNFDTANVLDMGAMFYNCKNLKTINLSNFITSGVTNMATMFSSCDSLISLDLSNFDTSKVTNMSSMFSYCDNLISLNLSSFDTSSVTNMRWMFERSSSLKSLDVSNFNTSNVEDISYMFAGLSLITNLDLSHFDTNSVISMGGLFSGCNSLNSLDLSNFDTSKVTNMALMFNGCSKLTTLDLSNFDTSKVTHFTRMFDSCGSLTSLNISNFDTSSAEYIASMFKSCYSLYELDLASFNTSNISSIQYVRDIFYGASRLRNISFKCDDNSYLFSYINNNYGSISVTCINKEP